MSAALAAYLHRSENDVRVLMPLYATLNRDDLEIQPVNGLQNLTVRIGAWDVEYDIHWTVLPNDTPVFLLHCPALYDREGLYTSAADEHLRFLLLSRAAIEMCQHMEFSPDIFHCHDWHAGLIPLYLKTIYAWDRLFADTRSVLTIHNIGYQGIFSSDILADLSLGDDKSKLHQDDLAAGRVNFLKTGLLYADLLTTVSPTYAREIQGSEYGMGLDDVLRARSDSLIGILNGVDDTEWNPETDPHIPRNFSSRALSGKKVCKKHLQKELGLEIDDQRPLLGIVSRLASQKGFDLMERTIPRLLQERDFALAVLGSGESRIERFFESLQRSAKGRVSFYRGYNNKLAHWIEAGSDMFLMPSRYEPCGLNQMYSLKYGTVPIVRETGGLADSVQQVDSGSGSGTGVLFQNFDEAGLSWAINRALDLYADQPLWRKIMRNGMAMDFSWQQQGALYVKTFRELSQK